jgi:hypothetical protein
MNQTKSLKTSGSFFNWLMSNNSSVPVVGEWATICHYSDRDVAKVVDVSKDGKTVIIEDYSTIASEMGRKIGMGHQHWEHTPTGHLRTLRYRNGGWKEVYHEVVFTDEWIEQANSNGIFALFKSLTEEQQEAVYGGDIRPKNVVEGITRKKKGYSKINILFGACDYHYDWTF